MQRKRKNIPHLSPLQFHNRPQIQFITICAEGRAPILACEEMHGILRSIWADANFWLVGRYVLMPDHLHLFCAPGKVDYPLEKWIAFWKREAALRWSDGAQQRSRRIAVRNAGVPSSRKPALFQRDYFDRQLRSHESYDAAWDYVRQNPVKAALTDDPDRWPYQGELNILQW